MLQRLLAVLSASCAAAALAAPVSFQLLTPRATSVAGGESRLFSVRFLGPGGAPAAGEPVTFSNDACGTFQNGMGSVAATTDASGVASAPFTASNPPGITCWVNARSGTVIATFDVLTYRLSGAYVTATTIPIAPRLGETFTVRASARFGIYPLANVELAARVVRLTAGATVTPASRVSPANGIVDFSVTPDGTIGDFGVEVDFRGRTEMVPFLAPASPLQDMWWAGAAENGWGVSIAQHGDRLFAVIYAYDAAGRPTWYVVPEGTWNAARTAFTGAVYSPRGSPFHAYDTSRFVVGAAVGSATIAFEGANGATLDYAIAGATGRKALSRQPFGPTTTSHPMSFGDMWWGGVSQDGWGIAVLQQHGTLFMVWFTYDEAGAPTWLVMPGGTWTSQMTWEGRIYRAAGSPWLGRAYDPAAFATTDVGAFRLAFDAAGGAALEYSVDGRVGTLALTRQPF